MNRRSPRCSVGFTLVELPAISQRQRAAFTLVELLVVIGIIAVLISILLPVLSKARESAIQVQCMSNLRQFGVADQMYVNQYNWHMPAWYGSATVPNAYNAYNRYWGGNLEFRKALAMPILDPSWPYVCYVTKKWYCPNAALALTPATPNINDRTNQLYFPLHYSYGMNVMGIDITPGGTVPNQTAAEVGAYADDWDPRATQCDPSLPLGKEFRAFKPTQVRHPAEKLHFADAMYMVINIYGSGIFPGWHGAKSNYDQTRESSANGSGAGSNNTQRTTAWRHKKGANVVFFDGHGEWLAKDRLYKTDPAGNIVRNDRLWKVMD